MTQRWARFNHDTFQLVDFDMARLKRTALALREACKALDPGDPRNPERGGYIGAWELWEGCKRFVDDAVEGRISQPITGDLPSTGYMREYQIAEPFFTAYCSFRVALSGKPAWVAKDRDRYLSFLENPEQFMKQEDGQWYIWEDFEDAGGA